METPIPKRRPRKSIAPEQDSAAENVDDSIDGDGERGQDMQTGSEVGTDEPDSIDAGSDKRGTRKTKRATRSKANGHAIIRGNPTRTSSATVKARLLNGNAVAPNPKVDNDAHFEFGGSIGVSVMMVTFPLLMYYMWIGQTYYDGHLPLPREGESARDFVWHLVRLVREGAFPTAKAWAVYWTFLIFEAICYLYLPGIYVKGKPLPHMGGKKLDYYCSGQWSWYVTIATAVALHTTGTFKLYTLIDLFGPLMSVAIISGFAVSIVAFASALTRGAQHRMTGYPIYDFFMGAELNPRLFGWLDFKMFFEVRLPWFMFFLITLGTAARQYDELGYVSAEVVFLLGAHFLYANACCKGEELIVITWYVNMSLSELFFGVYFNLTTLSRTYGTSIADE